MRFQRSRYNFSRFLHRLRFDARRTSGKERQYERVFAPQGTGSHPCGILVGDSDQVRLAIGIDRCPRVSKAGIRYVPVYVAGHSTEGLTLLVRTMFLFTESKVT